MNYFIYVKNIIGVKTNLESFNWVYGSDAPNSNETEFAKCRIKVNLQVKSTKEVFEKGINFNSFDKYNYFYANNNCNKIYYEREFLLGSKLRYSVEIIENNTININVNKNYYKFIKYKFMNLHSLGYILTDLVSGLLLCNGYATLHCSAVKINERTLVMFAPPSTGKTITAIRLCERNNAKFLSEDIALTDGEYIYSAPWTSTFRFYNHKKETRVDKTVDFIRRKIPLLQLISLRRKKSMDTYLGKESFINFSKTTDIIVLGKGPKQINDNNDNVFNNIINLNKYEFNYHKSPTMLALSYYNLELSADAMYSQEKKLLKKLLDGTNSYSINAEKALDYSGIIGEILN